MRLAFAKALAELADKDERILLLTGDLGYMALDSFVDRHPTRFLNAGVAEQNMLGVATGLAEAGYFPFVYSIATFASLRGYEFFRNGALAHRLPVRVVGVGGGFEYGAAGPTHHGLEDIAVMRAQPELRVIAPADHDQTRNALLQTWDAPGPTYYRLGKDDRTTIAGLGGRFAADRVEIVEGDRPSADDRGAGRLAADHNEARVALVAVGSVASEAAEASSQSDVSTRLVIVSTLNPAPSESLLAAIRGFDWVVSVESHYVNGGLGSLLAETIAEHGLATRLRRLGVDSGSGGRSGNTAYYRDKYGLSRNKIVATLRELATRQR